jgi:hypothetical protein
MPNPGTRGINLQLPADLWLSFTIKVLRERGPYSKTKVLQELVEAYVAGQGPGDPRPAEVSTDAAVIGDVRND